MNAVGNPLRAREKKKMRLRREYRWRGFAQKLEPVALQTRHAEGKGGVQVEKTTAAGAFKTKMRRWGGRIDGNK